MSASRQRLVWAIVPAAGRGERFAAANHHLPKQYTALAGKSILEWSLSALLDEPRVHGIVVVLAAGDAHWPAIAAKLDSPKLSTAIGGAERQQSVLNGLEFLAPQAADEDDAVVALAVGPVGNAAARERTRRPRLPCEVERPLRGHGTPVASAKEPKKDR